MANIFSARTATVSASGIERADTDLTRYASVARVALHGGTFIPREFPLPALLQNPIVSQNIQADARLGVLKLVVANESVLPLVGWPGADPIIMQTATRSIGVRAFISVSENTPAIGC
jgi:hypothetical protein